MRTLITVLAMTAMLLSAATSSAEIAAGSGADSAADNSVDAEVSEQAEALITRDPTVDDYGGYERCIDMKRIRTTKVLDERHLVIEMRHKDEYFVIQLPNRCPGLRKNRPVMTEPRGRHFCVHDTIRPMYNNGFGGLEPGIRCSISGFQAVTKEQVVQLRESLEIERKRERQERRERRQKEKANKAARTS